MGSKRKTLRAGMLGALLTAAVCSQAMGARIKDLASIKGIRGNQLIGYGLVVGLNGTGDKGGTDFTVQALVNMMERMGVHVDKANITPKNVAAVILTGVLPPFSRIGGKIDVLASSIGDAKSLQGGTLLLTPLRGVDGQVYALAQGPISVGGFSVGGSAGGGVTKNHPTVGRVPRGATIEKEIPVTLHDKEQLTITLHEHDFTTATRMRDAINEAVGRPLATAADSGTLKLDIPEDLRPRVVQLIATIEGLNVDPDGVAKVILNEKTGTVVIGDKVRISTVAVAHGNLSIQIKENVNVNQPSPFAPSGGAGATQGQYSLDNGVVMGPGGQTVASPDSQVSVQEEKSHLLIVPSGSTIGELVRALNSIGVSPRDLITIFQSIRAAGALQAEIEII